jgi:hypothetical protein
VSTRTFKPFLFVLGLILVVGLACGAPAPTQAPQQPADPPPPPLAQQPTDPPPPTTAETTSGDPQPFFTEEFDGATDLSYWSYFILGKGDPDKVSFGARDGGFLVDLQDKDLYAYFMYEPYTYRNVHLIMRADNLGRNNNNVSLICRYNGDTWYEFSTEGGGLWYLYAYERGYNTIADGGATSLKQGREVNTYEMICKDNRITLIINGVEVRSLTDTRYGFREGQVGFNISSLNVTPITLDVFWFDIREP